VKTVFSDSFYSNERTAEGAIKKINNNKNTPTPSNAII